MLPLRPESLQARWLTGYIHIQRSNYRKYLKGQPTTLIEERVKGLNSIGFKWYTSFMRALRKPNRSNII